MAENRPNQKNYMDSSDISSGRDTHIGDTIYNNTYIQGQTVAIPHLLTNHIPQNAAHILGRADELKATKAHLDNHQTTVLVNGIGGIGKTSVAAKFMVVYAADYAHRAWLTVQSSLSDAFVNNITLLDALHIAERVKQLVSSQQMGAALDCVLHHLNLLDKTLVVIDNANDLADLVEFKNYFDTAHCHFLITSRNRPQDWAVVPIEHLPEEEAVNLFRKLARLSPPAPEGGATQDGNSNNSPSGGGGENTAIKNLLSKLYFHTLLIELVAKAIASSGLSFEEMETIIEKRFIHDETLREELVATGKHGDSLPDNLKRATIEDYIWHIFREVKGLDDKSKDILRGVSLLPLNQAFSRDELKAYMAVLDIKDIVPTLTILTERGWLDKEQATGQKPKYKMHPLIADTVLKHLDVSVSFAEVWIKHVAGLIYYDNTNTKHNLFAINKHKPLAERLSELFFEGNREEMSDLLGNLGQLEEEFGFYQKSATLKERALAIVQAIFEPNHVTIAVRQSNLANGYKHLGRYADAATLLAAVLENAEKNLGKDHAHVAAYQSNLADVYRNLGRYPEAAALLETALASAVQNFGKDHPSVATHQSNLANVYGNLGKYPEAVALLETALASDVQNFGKDHPTVAIDQSNLANVYRNLGRYTEAAALLETALASDVQNFGKDHPTVAIDQVSLAAVYINMDRKPEAKTLLQAAYQNFLQNFGPEHPHTLAAQTWFPRVE